MIGGDSIELLNLQIYKQTISRTRKGYFRMKKNITIIMALVCCLCMLFASSALAARDIGSLDTTVYNTNTSTSIGSSEKKYSIQKGVVSLTSKTTERSFVAWCDIKDGSTTVNDTSGVANRVKYNYSTRPVFTYTTTVDTGTTLAFYLRGDKSNSASSCHFYGTFCSDSSAE